MNKASRLALLLKRMEVKTTGIYGYVLVNVAADELQRLDAIETELIQLKARLAAASASPKKHRLCLRRQPLEKPIANTDFLNPTPHRLKH
jgi:hypothetical protein